MHVFVCDKCEEEMYVHYTFVLVLSEKRQHQILCTCAVDVGTG